MTRIAALLLIAAPVLGCNPGTAKRGVPLGSGGSSSGGAPGAGGASSGGAAGTSDAGAPLPPVGTACTADADCASTLCHLGRCTRACVDASDCPPSPEWACTFFRATGAACTCAPSGPELCDGRDNDCNGVVDDSSCPGTLVCQNDACTCPTERQCGTGCFDLATDVAHCGACGTACPIGATCSSGACVCPGNGVFCDGTCVDLTQDPDHCGSCSVACDALEECVSGICTCSRALCGGSCVSLDDDPLNCGACGHDCLGGTCVQGLCQPVKIVDDPSPSSMVLYQDHLYWLSGTNVKRAALDGSSVTPLASGVDAGGYNGPSFAVTAGGVFWSSYWQIFGIPLDGSAPATMLVNEYDSGFELTAMTADESHLYWATAYGPIKRSNLDGTNVITLPVNVNETYSLAVNATKLYWSNLISYQMGLVDLVSSNLDGSNPTTLTAAVTGPTILATATHVYWGSSGQIWRRAVGGTTNEPLTSGNFECLAADATSIYWGGTVTASGITVAGIFRTPASGGTSMLLHPVLPRAVAVDTRFLYYTWNDYGSLTRHGVMRLAK